MREEVEQLISTEEINNMLDKMAKQISKDYKDKEIFMICVLKGGVIFMVDLARRLDQNVLINFMKVSSYGDDTKSSGNIKIVMDLDESITGKDVLIVEDIIDSGRTLEHLKSLLLSRNPSSLKVCTFLDKPDRRTVDVHIDYIGFKIPDEFAVGYGLDYAQRYRNLNYVGVLSFIED